jgi:TRAP-type uncharacterized transport system substrate-binding protein
VECLSGKAVQEGSDKAIAVFTNNMHIVTAEGKGIDKVTDLNGKRVSTGAPGSGTEVMALRALEAYGLDADRDMKRENCCPPSRHMP